MPLGDPIYIKRKWELNIPESVLNMKKTIHEYITRLFQWAVATVIPYLAMSALVLDFTWITSKTEPMFIGTRILLVIYSTLVFIAIVVAGINSRNK